MTDKENEAGLGHNSQTAFEAIQAHVNDTMEEARHWLDGAKVESEAEAEKIALLLSEVRSAGAAVEANRKAEGEPHRLIVLDVNARHKALTETLERAQKACKAALQPWLIKLEAERQEAARLIREEADEKARQAVAAIQSAAQSSNLESIEEAEAKLKEAKKVARDANRIDNARVGVAGGDRAVALRARRIAVVTDMTEAARHYWKKDPAAFVELVQKLASADARAGVDNVPGVTFETEMVAV